MLMAMDERVGTLCVQDLTMAATPAAGVAADLSHLEMPAEVKSYAMDPKKPAKDQLQECLTDCHIVLVPAGMPRKPGMTRDDLFNVNAGIAQGIVEACAQFCPEAVLLLIVNPVNSVVPAMAELYKAKGLDPKKIVGITTLDLVRANKFVARELGIKPCEVNVPVVGGHAGVTILPLISQTAGKSLSLDTVKALDKRIQEAGTEVVQAKEGKGSATLSMAYAGARLAKAVLSGFEGQETDEYCYVASDLCGLPYFSSKVTFGKTGVSKVHPLGELSNYETTRLEEVVKQLREEVAKGIEYTFKQLMADGASLFAGVQEAPADPILGTTLLFNKDEDPKKINLGVGAYRTSEGKPYVLPVILKAEQLLLEDRRTGIIDKESSPIDGPPRLKDLTQTLILGQDCGAVKDGRITSVQTLSGTGALRVVSEFVKKYLPAVCHNIFVSNPTWGNHPAIFQSAGLTVKTYPYWKENGRSLDFDGMIAAFQCAPFGSTVLLHACAHNPTGVDPTEEQWGQIADILLARRLVPVIDSAYQGYASGSLDKDAFACRLLEKKGLEMFVCQSFAKNLGLYGERVGMVHVICKDTAKAQCVLSQLKAVIRPMYSSPPAHGANLVMKVLGDEANCAQWKVELKEMADRILAVRAKLRKGLEDKGTPGTWNHVTDQIGMFSYTGLSTEQCERLIETHHIYLLKSGRISLAGLNDANLEHMVQAVDEVVRSIPSAESPPVGATATESIDAPAGSAVAAARALKAEAGTSASSAEDGSLFVGVTEAPVDPLFAPSLLFEKDEAAEKINLGVGAMRDNDGKPYILQVIANAEDALVGDMHAGRIGKEYSTIDGPEKLKEVSQALLFGNDATSVKNGCIASTQALSGTGALRVVGEFIKQRLPGACHTIYISDPSWGNHVSIFESSGLQIRKYPYWKSDTRSLDFEAMMNTLKEAPAGCCVLLQACAHNPTGVDPTTEQWEQIASLLEERKLIPLVDCAYQGLMSGNLEKDAFAIRMLESKGIEMFVCQSFAKNLGLDCERIGMAHVVCKNADRAKCVLSQLKLVIRPMFSSPPIHGAHLATRVLGDSELLGKWKVELEAMVGRVISVRAKLRKGLEDKGAPGTWNHVTEQVGLYSYLGLSEKVCERLAQKHHIFFSSGRISLTFLNDGNVEYMVQAVDAALKEG